MRVKGLNGREYNWDLRSKPDPRKKSSYHLRARALLAEVYPSELRLEEVYVPGSGRLFLDFYLPSRKLAIEVQGEQHSTFNLFLHGNKAEFVKSLQRDCNKSDWCELNKITLIKLEYYETDDDWRRKIEAGR